MSTDELDALIVRNLDDLDAAAKRLELDIEKRVGKVIDQIAETWARKQGWEGKFDFDLTTLWVAPAEWRSIEGKAEADAFLGFFELWTGFADDFDTNHENDYFWLTRLCGAGRGKIGFRWSYGRSLGATKPRWKRFLQEHREHLNQVRKTAFAYEEGSGLFFMPIRVEVEALAAAIIDNTIDEALKPFCIGLDRLLTAKPGFDALRQSAKEVLPGG
jgi:hypothetical protein